MRVSPATIGFLIKRGFRHLRLVLIHLHDVNRGLAQDKSAGIWYHPDCDCFEIGQRKQEHKV